MLLLEPVRLHTGESLDYLVSAPVAGAHCLVLIVFLCVHWCWLSHSVFGLGLTIFLDMRQTESTPLNILVNYWREVRERGENLSVVVKKGSLVTLCSSEWPTFGIGWPSVGTFDLQVIKAVKSL